MKVSKWLSKVDFRSRLFWLQIFVSINAESWQRLFQAFSTSSHLKWLCCSFEICAEAICWTARGTGSKTAQQNGYASPGWRWQGPIVGLYTLDWKKKMCCTVFKSPYHSKQVLNSIDQAFINSTCLWFSLSIPRAIYHRLQNQHMPNLKVALGAMN